MSNVIMCWKQSVIGLLALTFVVTPTFAAQPKIMTLDDGATSPPATIADIAWLEGRWLGEGLGGITEENIGSALDGQMMGMFRYLDADGTLKFYEFYTFAETQGSLTLRLKHFTKGLHGWEEKDDFVEFRLVAIGENAAYFDGLTYALTDTNVLESAVQIDGQGVAGFRFDRVTD